MTRFCREGRMWHPSAWKAGSPSPHSPARRHDIYSVSHGCLSRAPGALPHSSIAREIISREDIEIVDFKRRHDGFSNACIPWLHFCNCLRCLHEVYISTLAQPACLFQAHFTISQSRNHSRAQHSLLGCPPVPNPLPSQLQALP
jgi:hypothetical protein